MREKLNNLYKIVLSPPAVVLALSLVLLVFNVFLLAKVRPFNSDDVSWQNILLTWKPHNGHVVYLAGSDNFILKAPFFALLGHFFHAGRKLLFLESSILAVITFSLFYLSSLYFLKKLRITLSYKNLLPFIWFSSFGYVIAQLYLNPILRNFEIGLSFVFFVLAAKLYFKEIDPLKSWSSKIITILLAILAGALIYNDPYFLYFTIIPVIASFVILFIYKKISKKTLLTVFGFRILALVVSKIIGYLSVKIGLHLLFAEPIKFVSFNNFFSNISLTIHGILFVFGADFFEQNVVSLASITALFNLSLLIFITYYLYRFNKNNRHEKDEPNPYTIFINFFAGLSFFAILAYTLSSLEVNLETYRYLVIMVFSVVLILTMTLGVMSRGKLKTILTVVVLLATILNVSNSIIYTKHIQNQRGNAIDNVANLTNFATIKTMKTLGLVKGYAPYWDGNINSYLSGGQVQFLPISCINNKTRTLNYLVDRTLYAIPSSKSFLEIDPDLVNPPTCSVKDDINQFGKPNQIIKVSDKTFYIYNYDIYRKM